MRIYRHNNLVYLPITKHASTYYSDIFSRVLNWEVGDSSSIVFGRDHVFAHTVNPFDRHVKGTVEALNVYRLFEYIDHPLLERLLPVSVFDLHSYPLVTSMGEDWCYQIDWIPLDLPNHIGNHLTQKLLASYKIDIELDQYPKLRVVSKEHTEYRGKIKQLMDRCPRRGTLSVWFDRDVILYYAVTANIRDYEETWADISWLSHYKK